MSNFNPRSPWGERRDTFTLLIKNAKFQSTLPVGGATYRDPGRGGKRLFQSTLPVGGATVNSRVVHLSLEISIHAPRGGSDRMFRPGNSGSRHFNPRSPWGERPGDYKGLIGKETISIHAPRGGSDHKTRIIGMPTSDFNPRSPWGERRLLPSIFLHRPYFNPRSPWGERPSKFRWCRQSGLHFNPRSPWGERPPAGTGMVHYYDFNPRSPWGERPKSPDNTASTAVFQSTLPVGGATSGASAVVWLC